MPALTAPSLHAHASPAAACYTGCRRRAGASTGEGGASAPAALLPPAIHTSEDRQLWNTAAHAAAPFTNRRLLPLAMTTTMGGT